MVINNNLIEKVILGIDYSENSLTKQEQQKMEEELTNAKTETQKNLIRNKYKKSSASYLIGQNIAQKILASTLHPTDADENGKCKSTGVGLVITNPIAHPVRAFKEGILSATFKISDSTDVCQIYNAAISQNIDYVSYLTDEINDIVGFDGGIIEDIATSVSSQVFPIDEALSASGMRYYIFDYDYWGLLSVVASGAVVYLLIIFCIDCAVRLIKMAFLEITAPISVMAYIVGGADILKKWWKELYTTAISFFLRVAAISMIALVLMNLDEFSKNIPGYFSDLTRVFIIIGTLIFAKKIPELIEKVFGVKITAQGGIGGRLGQMAGVGKIAQNAWKSLGKTAKGVGTTALGLGLGGAVAAGKFGANKFDAKVLGGKGADVLDSIKNNDKIKTGFNIARAGISGGGGIKSLKDMNKALKDSDTYKYNEVMQRQKKAAELLEGVSAKMNVDNETGRNITTQAKRSENKNKISSKEFNERPYEEKRQIKEQLQNELIDTTRQERDKRGDRLKEAIDSKYAPTSIKYDEGKIREKAINTLEERHKKISDEFTNLAERIKGTDAVSNDARNKLKSYAQMNLETGNINKKQVAEDLAKYANNGLFDKLEANGVLGAINAKAALLNANDSEVKWDDWGIDPTKSVGSKSISDAKKDMTAMLESAKKAYEDMLGTISNPLTKSAVESAMKASEITIDDYFEELKKANTNKAAITDGEVTNIKDYFTSMIDPNAGSKPSPASDSTIILPGTPEYNQTLQNMSNGQTTMNNNVNSQNGNVQNNNQMPNNNIQQGSQANINGGTIHVDSIQADNISANTVSGNTFTANSMNGGFNPELQQDNAEQIGATRMEESSKDDSTTKAVEDLTETIEEIASEQKERDRINNDRVIRAQNETTEAVDKNTDASSNPDNKE